MNDANHNAKCAIALSAMADEFRIDTTPGYVHPYEVAQGTMVYHLRQAARICRQIAEDQAAKEKANAAGS